MNKIKSIINYLKLVFCSIILIYLQFNCIAYSFVSLAIVPIITSTTKDNINALVPFFVTGFCDGESSFTFSISKDNRERKTNRRLSASCLWQNFSVHPSFSIALNKKDENLIFYLQSYFGV